MKHKLILSALFCGAALFAETPVEFKVQPQMEWKKLDNGEYAVERTADLKHNAHLMLIMPELKPETFYAIEWEAKGENVENNGMVQYMLAMEQTVYPQFMVGKDWNLNRRYFTHRQKQLRPPLHLCPSAVRPETPDPQHQTRRTCQSGLRERVHAGFRK